MANNFLEKILNLLDSVGMRIPKNLEKVQEKYHINYDIDLNKFLQICYN